MNYKCFTVLSSLLALNPPWPPLVRGVQGEKEGRWGNTPIRLRRTAKGAMQLVEFPQLSLRGRQSGRGNLSLREYDYTQLKNNRFYGRPQGVAPTALYIPQSGRTPYGIPNVSLSPMGEGQGEGNVIKPLLENGSFTPPAPHSLGEIVNINGGHLQTPGRKYPAPLYKRQVTN
jgi:hypothetical protein